MAMKTAKTEETEKKQTQEQTPEENTAKTTKNTAETTATTDEAPETSIEDELLKIGFAKVKLDPTTFRGSFLDAKFDDEGNCERVSGATLNALKKHYPGVVFVSLEEIE